MTDEITVSIIVHGDYSHIDTALNSLYKNTQVKLIVFLIINTGYDAYIEIIRSNFPDVQIIINETPKGFAENHNYVMRRAQTDFVALLNDDICLHKNALDSMIRYLDTHPEAAITGPQLIYPDGSLQVSVYSDPDLLRSIYKVSGLAIFTSQRSFLRKWFKKLGLTRVMNVESLKDLTVTRSVPIVKGAVMIARRVAYNQAGMMVQATMAYGEEMDWHYRLRKAGWEIVYVAESQVTHYGLGQASLVIKGPMLIEDRKAILNYFIMHKSQIEIWIIRASIAIFHGILGTAWYVFQPQRAKTHFQVASMGLTWMPSSIRQEWREN